MFQNFENSNFEIAIPEGATTESLGKTHETLFIPSTLNGEKICPVTNLFQVKPYLDWTIRMIHGG